MSLGTPAPSGVPVLELGGVTVRRDGIPILAEVDWRLCSGERWVVLGPNGSGKTTLLQVAGARLWPTAGTVEILGQRLGRVDLRTLRPRVALVSGSVTRQLRADVTAREVVASGRHGALETWWNRYTSDDWAKAHQLLERGGVAELGERSFGVISEGERQQVLIARALMSDPELILLDEPFAGWTSAHASASWSTWPRWPPIRPARRWSWSRITVRRSRAGSPHAGLVSAGRLMATGALDEVITSENVSACFDIPVTVGCTEGRWWGRAL